jgi:hypothetical protein
MLCGALVWALYGLAGAFVVGLHVALGCIRLPGANRGLCAFCVVCLACAGALCVGVWSGVFVRVSLCVCLGVFGHGSPMYSPM